jgi:hypothetical protein
MATPRSPCGSADSTGKTVKAPDPQVSAIAPSSPPQDFRILTFCVAFVYDAGGYGVFPFRRICREICPAG